MRARVVAAASIAMAAVVFFISLELLPPQFLERLAIRSGAASQQVPQYK
jgi:hypothetical protein